MKVEQLISQYLFQQKNITLQGIGSFSISIDVPTIVENEKSFSLPEDAIHFEYNPKAEHDQDFLAYITKQTGKIKPLATSDLESYLILGKQFLNIGKPFVLLNMGSIIKTQSGVYEFIQTRTVSPESSEEFSYPQEKEKINLKINFSTPRKSKPAYLRHMPLIFAFVSVLIILTLIISLIFKNKKNDKEISIASADTTRTESSKIINTKTDTVKSTNAPASTKDSNFVDYKIVVRKYTDSASANIGYKKLSGYEIGKKLIKYKKDSSTYYLAVPIHGKLSDTTKIRDSVRVQFGKSTFIDLN